MNEKITKEICTEMANQLSNNQMKKLEETLYKVFNQYDISLKSDESQCNGFIENTRLIELFVASKKIEGCSEKSLRYYSNTLVRMIKQMKKDIREINTNDLRFYLSAYQQENSCSKVTLDNIRRILSSFFAWLEDEDYIAKSPVRRIKKIKTTKLVKETFSDENLEKLRDCCIHPRDRAILDLLVSTGIRVGELVKLNISDVNLVERECIVLGKGDKERPVYFDAKTKIHLEHYLKSRKDNNPALFVTIHAPYNRLSIGGVEHFLSKLGKISQINHVHPHKFRRTMATMAIEKGMPIEQVQKLLGHSKIDTTMHYAIVNQSNVKISHRKYIG
ncbi:MAG: site-specific tyrosine recombinase/integron integrase [Eubacterium sp.]|nr:site-specific tyrosine recombinase/integron integrase [Eubacterium sp.]